MTDKMKDVDYGFRTVEKDVLVLEDSDMVKEYAQPGPMVVEGPDGHYTVLMDEDLIMPAPNQEDIQREIDLVKLVRKAVDRAEKYYKARREDKDNVMGPVWIVSSFFVGCGFTGAIWWLLTNGYIGR